MSGPTVGIWEWDPGDHVSGYGPFRMDLEAWDRLALDLAGRPFRVRARITGGLPTLYLEAEDPDGMDDRAAALARAEGRRRTLVFPLPPALNEMIHLAGTPLRRARGGASKSGGNLYSVEKRRWERDAARKIRRQSPPPSTPWERWRLEAVHFRCGAPRDPTELLAGLKWPVDTLVRSGYVAEDSPRHLAYVPSPTQSVDRLCPGVDVTISEAHQ